MGRHRCSRVSPEERDLARDVDGESVQELARRLAHDMGLLLRHAELLPQKTVSDLHSARRVLGDIARGTGPRDDACGWCAGAGKTAGWNAKTQAWEARSCADCGGTGARTED